MKPIPQHGVAIQQAIEWHQRLKQGELDPTTQRKFHDWLQSRSNLEELARICMIDSLLGRDSLKQISLASLPENVVPFDSYATAARPRVHESANIRAVSFWSAKLAIAAGVVLAVLIAAVVTLVGTDQTIVTRQGRWAKQLLDDGSVVYTGPQTKLRLHFDDEMRAVTFVRGEALFEVARESGRPFIVSTKAGSVQALGTAFAMADRGNGVVVTVAKGKAVATSAAGVQPMQPLQANEQLVLLPSGAGVPAPVNAEREIKWIRNWYEYDGEQVGEIVAQLNRRHATKVVMNDPHVAHLRMNGLAFRPSQPEDFVAQINRWYRNYPHKAGGSYLSGDALHLQRT